MNLYSRIIVALVFTIMVNTMAVAQNFKTDRLKKAAEILKLQISTDSIMPEQTYFLTGIDGRRFVMRTDPMGAVDHIGIPLFADMMRLLQPSPVYDFLEYALLNWKYKISPNQLYLSKVIFKSGNWTTLLNENLYQYDCSIIKREDKLYVVSWVKDGKEKVTIGIPIEYELLNNDTRRNMELSFIKELETCPTEIIRSKHNIVDEKDLCIYGTEGLFVMPRKSYLIDHLNQNVYYKLTTVTETTDTIVRGNPICMTIESILPVVVRSQENPAETFANLMNCDDTSVPEVNMELDFHLSNYKRYKIVLPLSSFKAICRQQGCDFYFACDGVRENKVGGVMFASNLSKGYNHMMSINIPIEQLTDDSPTVHADVYLYIPPIDKSKLFGTAPTKKSKANFKLP